jgi:putative transposase
MSQSLAKILVHGVFSTKERRPFLRDRSLTMELHCYLGGVLNEMGCQSLLVGGVEGHVHLLFALSRTRTPADTLRDLKRSSSAWVKSRDLSLRDFAWQNGYGLFSVGFSQVEQVRRYILGQPEHHRKVSFQDELRSLLKRYRMDYDERYVWD